MKLRRIEPIAVRLPMRRAVKMAGELVSAAHNVLVRLETEDGIVGWGEAASAPTMTGETVASMVAAVNQLAPALSTIDDLPDALARMQRALPGNHGAKAAIDIALHDAFGKATGKPVYELLGGARRESVPLLWTLATGAEADDIAEALDRRRAGYGAFKIKVGIADARTDAARTAAICRELRGAALVCADANQGWSRDEALRYVREIEPVGLAFLEQPVAADDVDGMAQVAAASRVPIAFDEGVHDADDIRRHHAARAAAGGSLKAIKLGGLGEVMVAAVLCHSLGMKVNLACKIAESGIAAAALLHLAAAVPAAEWGVSPTSHHLEDDLLASPLRIVNGRADVPRGPGLGIDVREQDVARYRNSVQRP
jgi:L-alanine-DL-glutamate epimerase-like enolase superfamily enzyme